MRAEIPELAKRGGGVIINTTSVAGLRGFPAFSSYVASKFAVEEWLSLPWAMISSTRHMW